MPITGFYAALIGFLFLYLSRNAILARRAAQVAVGDGGDRRLLRAMRVQANCAEYAPIALILLALSEAAGTPALVLHGFGLVLVAGRVIHAHGVAREPENLKFRVAGMAMTITMIAAASLTVFAGAIMHWVT